MFPIGISPLPGIAAVSRQHERVVEKFFPSFSVEKAMQAALSMAEKLVQPFFNRLFAKAHYPYRIQMDITGQDGKVGFFFHQKMEMIVPQDIGKELDGIDSERQGQKAEELCPVLIVPEDALPFVAAARYVITAPGYWMRNGLAMVSCTLKTGVCQQ